MAQLTAINVSKKINVECREIAAGAKPRSGKICVICEICVT